MPSATDRYGLPASSEPLQNSLALDEGQLAALFAVVAEPIYVEEITSRHIVYWSPSAATLFGYTRGDIRNQSASRLHEDAFSAGDRDAALSELQVKGTWRGRRRFRRVDGSVFVAETHMSLVPTEGGKYAVVIIRPATAVNPDDTAQPRTAEPAPELSPPGEKSIGHLLRNIAHYGVFTTDTAGRLCEWNREAGRLFGYDGAEVLGKHLALVCVEDSARTLQKIFEQAKEQGSSRYYQWMTRKDGKRFYARVIVFALWDNAGVQGFLFLLRDDLRDPNLRQILREKEQMAAIGTAASILAHEIGNPLNGISATVQLLEHYLGRPNLATAESMLSSVHDLKSEVKRLTELLSEFKNIAWPQKLALGPADITRLIQQLVREIEKRSQRQNVEVSVHCQADLPLLNGDDDKLKQALHNVIDNALDAMPQGGRLEIKAYHHEQAICIDIVDTGVGIPKNLKVFDLFSSTKPDGIGLGLFLVQQIVLAHDGAISYSSTPGQGTTFHVAFALNPAPDPSAADFIDII